MKLEIEAYSALCALKIFNINDIEADYEDFGEKYDADSENAPDYCCADMRFFPKLPTQEILDKYGINVAEYNKICEELDCLSFGSCGWCE